MLKIKYIQEIYFQEINQVKNNLIFLLIFNKKIKNMQKKRDFLLNYLK